jgi:hypothetical protein
LCSSAELTATRIHWTRHFPTTHPDPLADDLMAYDGRTKTCLLVGSGQTTPATETWSWDGTSWTRLSDLDIGHYESIQALAFDPVSGQVILLTHLSSSSGAPISTRMWTWDGHGWTSRRLAEALPIALSSPLLATIGTGQVTRLGRGVLAVFGIADGSHQTWRWDGLGWTKLAAGSNPPYDPLSPTMAEDPATQSVVLVGTGDAAGGGRSTWLWDGTMWRESASAPSVGTAFFGTAVLTDTATTHAVLVGAASPGSQLNIFDVLWTYDGQKWLSESGV